MATHQKGPAERRYHKLAVALWNDRVFRGLSERAKLLYYRLAAGPETLPVPGVARLSRSGLALDELRWGLEEFDARLAELQQAGLVEADFQAGLVVLPRELAEPFSMPNGLPSVTSWRRALANAPDCELLDLVKERVLARISVKGPRWIETFMTPGDDGSGEDEAEQPQGRLFDGKLAASVPPKVQKQIHTQTQKPNREEAAAEAASPEPAAPPVCRLVNDLEDLPDLTRWAKEVRTVPPPVPKTTRPTRKKAAPAPRPAPPANPRQAALPLMPAPDPEHCAAVVARAAGQLFAHGPLLPGRATELGGELHPAIRKEWQRVLAEYFGPLHYTADQVDATLLKLGQWIAMRGEAVTLQVLVKFRGERLQQFIATALAWNGGRAAAPRSRPPDESRRYPLRDAEDHKGAGAAAVLGAAERKIRRELSTADPATVKECLAALRQLSLLRDREAA